MRLQEHTSEKSRVKDAVLVYKEGDAMMENHHDQQLSIRSPRLREIARKFLVRKGCVIEQMEDGYELITFPVGTEKRGQRGDRGQFMESAGEYYFPDGTFVEELVDAHLSYLQLPREAFELQEDDVSHY